MSIQKKNVPHWTAGEIIISKPLTVLLLTAVLTGVIVIKLVDPISTAIANSLGIVRGSTAESIFVITCLIVSLIAAAILAVILLKLVCNAILAHMTPEEAAAKHAKAARPKWNIVYSILLGYLLLLVLSTFGMKMLNMWTTDLDIQDISSVTRRILTILVCCLLPYIVAALAVMGINKGMVRLTRTNQELIEEIRAGQHDAKIPEYYRNEKDIEGIIRILNGAQASTVRGAVAVYWTKCSLIEVGRALAKVSRVLAVVLGVIAVIVTLGCVRVVDSWGDAMYQDIVADNLAAETQKRIDDKAAAVAEKLSRERWFKAKQADKKAWFDEQQARKAVRSDPNSYSTRTKINRAQASREQAKQLNRDKYRND